MFNYILLFQELVFGCVAVHRFSPFDLWVCHTSFDILYISGCSNWCLCRSQWHNRNINVLCMEEFQLQGWPHCRYVNSRKIRVTVRLMHFDCADARISLFCECKILQYVHSLWNYFIVFCQVVDCSTAWMLWVVFLKCSLVFHISYTVV